MLTKMYERTIVLNLSTNVHQNVHMAKYMMMTLKRITKVIYKLMKVNKDV